MSIVGFLKALSLSDALARLMYRKVHTIEYHFNSINSKLEDVLRTEIKLGERYILELSLRNPFMFRSWDAFAESIKIYSEDETSGVKDALADYAEMLQEIQKFRRQMVCSQLDHYIKLTSGIARTGAASRV